MTISTSAPRDVALSISTHPGLFDPYRTMGLSNLTIRGVEVRSILYHVVTAYPQTRQLERLARDSTTRDAFQKIFEHRGRPIFVGSFLTGHVRELLTELACQFRPIANPPQRNYTYTFGTTDSARHLLQVRLDSTDDLTLAAQLALEVLQRCISKRRGTAGS